MPPSSDQQQLAKTEDAASVPVVITSPAEYVKALARWQQANYNVLTPFSNFTGLAQGYALMVAQVVIDTNPDRGEVYDEKAPWIKAGYLALSKVGLRKIKEAAGMSTIPRRTDPMTIQNFWMVHCEAVWRGLDGTPMSAGATEEWDMRDGSARSKGFTPAQVNEARKHGLRHCETRAINAAIREYGLRQMYTKAEMARPFVVLRVVYLPDYNDADTRRQLLENSLAGVTQLYGGPSGTLAGTVLPDDDAPEAGTIIDHPAQDAKPAAPVDERPTVDAVKIKAAEPREFTYQNGAKKGQKGTRYVIVDSTGTEYTTFSETHYKDAARFKAENAWVEIGTETRGQYTDIIEIVRAGSEPKLPGVGDPL